MKIFWGLIGVLAIIAAALLVGGGEPKTAGSSSESLASGETLYNALSEAPPHSPEALAAGPEAAPVEAPTGTDAGLNAQSPAEAPSSPPAVDQPPPAPADAGAQNAAAQENTKGATPSNAREAIPTGEAAPSGHDSAPTRSDGDAPILQPNAPADISASPSKERDPVKEELDSLIDDLTRSAKEDSPAEAEPSSKEAPEGGAAPVEAGAGAESTDPAATGAAAAEAPAAVQGEALPAPAPDPLKPEIIPSKFEEREDGSTLVDARFVIRGKGTKEEPYQVTWDMLVATAELYDPRRNRLKLPERVKMLDGKYVTIVGYVAFPIVAEGANEMLAMLNSWDGCCIGVPPTPYDAVEVRLRTDATAEQMLLNWGSVTGRFKVEPYLAANWLLGLYLMEDAVLKAEGP